MQCEFLNLTHPSVIKQSSNVPTIIKTRHAMKNKNVTGYD